MALRKDDLYDGYDKGKHTMKRSRITIDLSPELRKRIKKAASEHDVSISKFLTQIIEEAIPTEESMVELPGHPVTLEAIERLHNLREQIFQRNNGQYFEDSAEAIRKAHEERTRYLMGEEEER
jgi:predicted DNA-binding protein